MKLAQGNNSDAFVVVSFVSKELSLNFDKSFSRMLNYAFITYILICSLFNIQLRVHADT
jgi:hypothetical protein